MKKELLIDLSWINTKFSGGGYHSVQNIVDSILKNKTFLSKYNFKIILRKNVFKKKFSKKVQIIELPNLYLLNFLIRWFILFFLSNQKNKTSLFLPEYILCII